MNARQLTFTGLMTMALAAGCGGGSNFAPVSGKVTLDGKPVPNATVIFVPINIEPRSPSYGATNEKGEYSLQFSRNRSGAILAEHSVQIVTEKPSKGELREMKEAAAAGGPAVPEYVPIPSKYNEGTLVAQVKRGKNEIDFQLTSK